MGHFEYLGILDVWIRDSLNHNYNGNMECLKNCKSLKILDLINLSLNDEKFKNIDLHLPQLKAFRIRKSNCILKEITDSTLKSLSKMKNLRYICVTSDCVTDSGVCHLIENYCPKLKIFLLYIERYQKRS